MSSLDVTSDFSDNSLELSDNSSDKSSSASFSEIKEDSVLLSDRSDSSHEEECIRRRNPAGIAAFKKKILDHLRSDRQKTEVQRDACSPLKRQESLEVASVAKRKCYRASSDSTVSSTDSESNYELDQMIIDASKYLDEISTEGEFYKAFSRENRRVALKGFPEKTNRDDIMSLLSTYGLSFDTVHMDRNGASCKIRNELHNNPVEGEIHRLQVHWIDRIHDVFKSHENLYSAVLFISIDACDELKIRDLIDKIREHEKPIYISKVNLDDANYKYLITEFDTPETAANAHRFINESDDFKQVSFCVPRYSAIVLQKSLETIYEKFNDFAINDGSFGLLKTPPKRETQTVRSELSVTSTMSSAPTNCSTPVLVQNSYYQTQITNSSQPYHHQQHDNYSRATHSYFCQQTVYPNSTMITPATNTQTCQTSYTNAQCSAQFQSAHYAQKCTTGLSGSATSTPCYGALQASTFASSSAQPQFDVQQWQAQPSSAPPQQLRASCIPFSHRRALSYAHHPQFQARESLCQDLFNVGTADPSTNQRIAQERTRKMYEEKERKRMQQAFRRAEQKIYAFKAPNRASESNSAPSYFDHINSETIQGQNSASLESVQDSPKSSNYLGNQLMKSLDLISPDKTSRNPSSLSFNSTSSASTNYEDLSFSGSPAVYPEFFTGFTGQLVGCGGPPPTY
ncbi:unnamed protein product [Oikopleura dioica]|uniref:Uncharacterized protein n=1 Tax=Oikopleura dioica TaxID=34765 RepID=E4YAJ9_OIKDI|nr:unnamed protein product [Oikopleura dioica]